MGVVEILRFRLWSFGVISEKVVQGSFLIVLRSEVMGFFIVLG